MGRLNFGKEGEQLAVEHLKKKGYKIIERNYRTPFGEIDIIAKDRDYLVIIEVKRRASDIFGEPLLAVNKRKQLKLKKLALYYLKCLGKEYPIRFDVISIKGDAVEHIENAF